MKRKLETSLDIHQISVVNNPTPFESIDCYAKILEIQSFPRVIPNYFDFDSKIILKDYAELM